MQKHKCIKCFVEYEDSEIDDYYCGPCNEVRKQIAKDVDAKLANIPKTQVKSALQIYDEIRKAKGTPFVGLEELNRHLK